MTNYNGRLDKMAVDLWVKYGRPGTMEEFVPEAKQAITSLIKELVAEAKPEDEPVCENSPNPSVSRWCNKKKCWTCRERDNYELWGGIGMGIEKFEQNLLKALEEVLNDTIK